MVELLTVIAVIGVLAGLLLPALGRARAKAQGIFCLNNLRQWGLATQFYTGDHDDFLPPDGTPNPDDRDTNTGWYIQLPATLSLPRYHDMCWRTNANIGPGSSVWICPANKRRSNGRNLFHYCLNEHINGTDENNRPVRLSALNQPSALVWLFDSKNLPAVGFWNYVHTNIHGAGAQFVFLDGHAARFRSSSYWNLVAGRPSTNCADLRWIP